MNKKSISITLPENVLTEMETFIDGVIVRSRSHALLLAVTEWMERKRSTDKGEQMIIKPSKKRIKK